MPCHKNSLPPEQPNMGTNMAFISTIRIQCESQQIENSKMCATEILLPSPYHAISNDCTNHRTSSLHSFWFSFAFVSHTVRKHFISLRAKMCTESLVCSRCCRSNFVPSSLHHNLLYASWFLQKCWFWWLFQTVFIRRCALLSFIVLLLLFIHFYFILRLLPSSRLNNNS